VAKQHRQSLKSLVGEKALQTVLENRVKKVVRESHPEKIADPEAGGLVCGIALNLFEHAVKSEERSIAQRAASIMAYFELQRGSLESGAALYERLLAIKPAEPEAGYARLEYFETQYRQRIEILESLAVIYRNLDWPARSAKALRRLKGEATQYLELPDEFLAAQDKGKAVEIFERWRRDNPRIPVSLYAWSVAKIVSAYLNLSELALAGFHPNAAEGDEQFTPSSFGIVAYEVTDGVTETDRPVEIPTQTAEILVTLAYAQDGVLGDGEAEKQHCRLLEQLGRRAIDRSKFEAAEEYLQRALRINEVLGDELFQLSTLNNLAVTFGQRGDVDRATKYLELAVPLVNSYMKAPTFPVDLIMEYSGPDGPPVVVGRRRVEPQTDRGGSDDDTGSRWTRRVQVPVRFSKEFEENPDEVLRKDRTMMGVIASVFGNAGHRALAKEETPKAKQNFLSALSIHEEIGDPEGAFHDLERLTHIAYITGEREEVCAHLRRCLALASPLQQVDPRRWKNIDRQTKEAMREAGCTDEEATVVSTDPEPKEAPSSDHPLQS
jgi:tetratricopeptide (TPR) repeat protein